MQDGKNLIMAIVLCLLVVVGWSYLADYMGWVVKPDPAEIAKMEAAQAEQAQKAQAEAEAKQKAQAEPLPAFTPAPGVDVTVDAPLYKAVRIPAAVCCAPSSSRSTPPAWTRILPASIWWIPRPPLWRLWVWSSTVSLRGAPASGPWSPTAV